MATQNVVIVPNLGLEFDIGTIEANKIRLKIDGSLTRAADGTISVNQAALTIVSGDAGNILTAGGDGGAFVDQAAIQAVETVWAGTTSTDGLTITAGGTNGHTPTINIDWTHPTIREAVQDHIGAAALNGAGITYDDAMNALNVALQNLSAGPGIAINAGAISVVYSADAGNLAAAGTDGGVNVAPAGVLALATEDVCDAFGVHLFDAMP